jgi:hypothetical protein
LPRAAEECVRLAELSRMEATQIVLDQRLSEEDGAQGM